MIEYTELNVLIAEDNGIAIRGLHRLLSRKSLGPKRRWEITIVENGCELADELDKLRLNPKLYDIILTDDHMPPGNKGSDCIWYARKILQLTEFPIYLMSGGNNSEEATGYISKPFTQDTLIRLLDQYARGPKANSLD